MVNDFFKDKKKIGILGLLIIIIIVLVGIYMKTGYKELKKNDTENIFIEEDVSSVQVSNSEKNISNKNTTSSEEKSFSVNNKKIIVVEIKGEVNKPDVYSMEEDSIIKDLIEKAGGVTEEADLSNINRAKKLQNHELIYIKNKNDKNELTNIEGSNLSDEDLSKKVNINSASINELKTLNGIGDSKAKGIIEYREKNDGFKAIDEIKNVSGIGDAMFEKIKDNIEI